MRSSLSDLLNDEGCFASVLVFDAEFGINPRVKEEALYGILAFGLFMTLDPIGFIKEYLINAIKNRELARRFAKVNLISFPFS